MCVCVQLAQSNLDSDQQKSATMARCFRCLVNPFSTVKGNSVPAGANVVPSCLSLNG